MAFPEWFGGHKCVHCNSDLTSNEYLDIGFSLKGDNKGKMFIRYGCANCDTLGILFFGDENYNLERLCSVVIDYSNLLDTSEKIHWKRKYLGKG